MKRVFCGDSNTLFFDEEHRENKESPIHTKCIINLYLCIRGIKGEISIIEKRRKYYRNIRNLISWFRK